MLEVLRTLDRSVFAPLLLLPAPGPLSDKALQMDIAVAYINIPAGILRRKRYAIRVLSLRTLWDAICLVPVIWRVTRLLRREHIDIVHTNTLKAHLIGGISGRLCGIPVVWHFRDILIRSSLRFWIIRLSCWLCNHVIAISCAVRDQFGDRYPAERITVIYNAVNSDEIRQQAAKRDRAAVVRELGLPPGARMVGMVGQIARWKGQEHFIRAAGLLASQFPDVRFLVIGDVLFEEWDYKQRLQLLVRELGLEQRVLFTGQHDDVYALMAAQQLIVHCSVEPEPFGRILIEAMALRVPVVATDGGAVPEIIEQGFSGTIVPPGDSVLLAQAIATVLRGTAPLEAMTVQAFATVQQRFSSRTMLQLIQTTLLETARPGGARTSR